MNASLQNYLRQYGLATITQRASFQTTTGLQIQFSGQVTLHQLQAAPLLDLDLQPDQLRRPLEFTITGTDEELQVGSPDAELNRTVLAAVQTALGEIEAAMYMPAEDEASLDAVTRPAAHIRDLSKDMRLDRARALSGLRVEDPAYAREAGYREREYERVLLMHPGPLGADELPDDEILALGEAVHLYQLEGGV